MAQVGRIIGKTEHVTDDGGNTYRSVRVLLPNGHEATAHIHDTPGDWVRYKEGDRVRLSINQAAAGDDPADSSSGMAVIGKFGDDFEPVGEKNREIHGPSDGNLVLRSRNDVDINASDTVRLGNGSASSQLPIALNNESLGDAEAIWDLLDITDKTSPLGAIFDAINTGLSGALTPLYAAYTAAYQLAKPSAKGAENVTAKPEEE